MSFALPLVIVLVLALGCNSAGSRETRATGSFVIGKEAGCALQSSAVDADSVRFQLSCQRGPPSYNLGFVSGRLALVNDRAEWRTTEYGGSCVITMHFLGDRVQIEQIEVEGGCGFGYGVQARGELRRLSAALPPFDLAPDGSRVPP